MPPIWLAVLAWISLVSAFPCAVLVTVDVFVRGYRQAVWIMDIVWPLTAPYSGPLGWLAYHPCGRLNSVAYRPRTAGPSHYPFWVSVGIRNTTAGPDARSAT